MTDAQFAENFGVSAKTISRALDKLEQMKLIKRETKTIASKRIRTITASNGQNDSLTTNTENLRQSICPSETVNLSNSDGQNDSIKDKGKDKIKDNLQSDEINPKVEGNSVDAPIMVNRDWMKEHYF